MWYVLLVRLFIIVKVYWKNENNSTARLNNVTKLWNTDLSQKFSKKSTGSDQGKPGIVREITNDLIIMELSGNFIWNFSPNSRNYLR